MQEYQIKSETQLIAFIKENFPEPYNTPETFEQYVRDQTQNHRTFLSAVIWPWIKQIESMLNNQYRHRPFCRVDERNQQKTWESIAEKIRRSQQSEESQDKRLTFNNFHLRMTDLVRLRIVCTFLPDVHFVDRVVRKAIRKTPRLSQECRIKHREDTINVRPGKRKSGHRSVKIITESKRYPNTLLEIQIMTQLQEAWDNKDHYLIYEAHRAQLKEDESNFPGFEDAKMFAMAELLYVADQYFEHLRKELEQKGRC